MTVTAKELRFNTSMLFDFISKGESVTITYRGKAKAVLSPVSNTKIDRKESAMFGLWNDKELDIDTHIRDIRKGRSFDI